MKQYYTSNRPNNLKRPDCPIPDDDKLIQMFYNGYDESHAAGAILGGQFRLARSGGLNDQDYRS